MKKKEKIQRLREILTPKKRTVPKRVVKIPAKPKKNTELLSFVFQKQVSDMNRVFSAETERTVSTVSEIREELRLYRAWVRKYAELIKKLEQEGYFIQQETKKDINSIRLLVSEVAQKKETDYKPAIKDLYKEIEDIRSNLLMKLASHGGNMNRQILVGGTNPLTTYTDYNIIAGPGITITTANDDTNKSVNLTIVASGAGSGVAYEEPVGAVDDSNVTFTVTNTPIYIIVNGAQYFVGTGAFQSYVAPTITLAYPVGTGGFIRSAYAV